MRGQIARLTLVNFAAAVAATVPAQYYRPLPYVKYQDSPIINVPMPRYFFLETFEDGALNTPGVSASTGLVLGPAPLTDSVDADDGSVNGFGTGGHSYYIPNRSVRFSFNPLVLGYFPNGVGVVWTDVGFADIVNGIGPVEFEAFDRLGSSLGTQRIETLGDGLFGGQTAEDRFFGVVWQTGISAIEIRMPTSSDWEIDHLQYGSFPVIRPLPPLR